MAIRLSLTDILNWSLEVLSGNHPETWGSSHCRRTVSMAFAVSQQPAGSPIMLIFHTAVIHEKNQLGIKSCDFRAALHHYPMAWDWAYFMHSRNVPESAFTNSPLTQLYCHWNPGCHTNIKSMCDRIIWPCHWFCSHLVIINIYREFHLQFS